MSESELINSETAKDMDANELKFTRLQVEITELMAKYLQEPDKKKASELKEEVQKIVDKFKEDNAEDLDNVGAKELKTYYDKNRKLLSKATGKGLI